MELWIRSQDREILAKAEHLDVYNASVEDEELFVIEECGTDLGSYNTKERALEVLDEIDKYMSNAVNNGLNVAHYEMPKE